MEMLNLFDRDRKRCCSHITVDRCLLLYHQGLVTSFKSTNNHLPAVLYCPLSGQRETENYPRNIASETPKQRNGKSDEQKGIHEQRFNNEHAYHRNSLKEGIF